MGQLVECVLPLREAVVSGGQRLADGVHGRVQTERDTKLALVEQDGGGFVDGVAAAVEFAALRVALVTRLRDDGAPRPAITVAAEVVWRNPW
jgi:hypothetical protein